MAEIVVVGGGFAGLLQAALLSKKNKVTLLEQNNCFGGLAKSINVQGKKVYLGAHHIGGISSDGVWKQCFEHLDLELKDYFDEIDEISFYIEGNIYKLPVRLNCLHERIKKIFPNEANIDSFFELLYEYQYAFEQNTTELLYKVFMENINCTFLEVIDKYTSNELLKKIILSYAPGYAGLGFEGNAFTVLSLIVSYGMGSAYIKDNNESLIEKLLMIIKENKGELLCNAKATRIQYRTDGMQIHYEDYQKGK